MSVSKYPFCSEMQRILLKNQTTSHSVQLLKAAKINIFSDNDKCHEIHSYKDVPLCLRLYIKLLTRRENQFLAAYEH